MTWQWAGRRPGAGLPRLLPRAGRPLQRWCGPAETWRRCACRLCCGFPGATYLRAKIQHFITSAKCLGVFRSATPKRPAPAAPSAVRGASAPRRRPHCPPAEPAAAVCKVFAQCAASGPTAWRPTHCETGHSAAQNSPLRPAIQAVWPTGTGRRTGLASRRGGAGSCMYSFFAGATVAASGPPRHFAAKYFAVTPVFLIFA